MMPEMGVRKMIGGGGGDFENELGLLLREQRRQETSDRERELNLYRSGSAPPTVEGSLAAVGGMFGRDTIGGGVTDDDLLSDPAYLSYYYSHANLNPRLPPPVLSKEDWRFTQRLQAGGSVIGGIGDRRKINLGEEQGSSSLFSLQPGFNQQKEEGEVESEKLPGSGEWLDRGGDGLIGLPGLALGRQKSFAGIFQDDLGRATPVSGRSSRPPSRNALGNGIEPLGPSEAQLSFHHEIGSLDGQRPGGNVQNVSGVQNNGVLASHTFASVVGKSLPSSATPDPLLVARAPSPRLPPVGVRLGSTDKRSDNGSCSFNGVSSDIAESDNLVAALSGMSLSGTGGIDEGIIAQAKLQQEIDNHKKFLFDSQGAQNNRNQHPFLKKSDSGHLNMSPIPHLAKPSYSDLARKSGGLLGLSNSAMRPNGQDDLQKPTPPSVNSYLKAPSAHFVTSTGGLSAPYLNTVGADASFTSYGFSGYSPSMMANQIGISNLPPLFENAAVAAAASAIGVPGMDSRELGGFPSGSISGATHFQNLARIGNQTAATAASLQMPLIDPLYIQYLRETDYAQVAANYGDPSMESGYVGNSYVDLLGIQKDYLGTLLQPQKPYGMPFLGESGGVNNGYYGHPSFDLGISYPGSPLASPVFPTTPRGTSSPVRHGERSIRLPSGLRNFAGGAVGSWHSDTNGYLDDSFPPSLLDEFKSNKTKCYELAEIAGHVVEFSADQYGSRFIQQKLETATTEEKNMVFEEIMPQAFSLMTDVFGNYVIQKFFEHGSAAQRRELAGHVTGHVLTLSLQMYGCRVIQKAIEVVDLDQQTKMVTELDGHVMRCVRDQNGNHVIQKCIECVPQDAIQFIISSFYDQVVTLSTHPYGCRVIQRVLEHCDDPKTQQIMMDGIMGSVGMLAQDQYGNYVIQHVLEHGKPHERSAIIKKLAGQIVQMSQQKFASNVVEKCLTFGGPMERQFLVNEIVGSTDENEPLQAMMKDQFANYVVQKVLETCDDQQRELILSRVKVHLNALKKYTYGKHIVARVEKLVAAGERRIGVQSSYSS